MKPSKRKFQQGGSYENKTDFVLKPMDYAALGAGYDEMIRKRLAEMDRAEKEQRKKDLEGIKDCPMGKLLSIGTCAHVDPPTRS